MSGRFQRNAGFAVAAAIVTLVLVTALMSGALFVAEQGSRAASAALRASRALYAAEAGLQSALRDWNPATVYLAAPGIELELGSATLGPGGTYTLSLVRLDRDPQADRALLLLESVGTGRRPGDGRRRLALALRDELPDLGCCDAALVARRRPYLARGALLSGLDTSVPRGAAPGSFRCGQIRSRAGLLTVDPAGPDGGGLVTGLPATAPLATSEPYFAAVQKRLTELAARADRIYQAGAVLRRVGPVLDPAGRCAVGAPGNWGAPLRSAHPCALYFPVIHARGDLRVAVEGRGQGLLLVDGDLELGGGFEFFGVVIVQGRVRLRGASGGGRAGDGGARIYGGLVALSPARRSTWLERGSAVHFSSCSVRRTAAFSQVHIPHPLAERAWFQILE